MARRRTARLGHGHDARNFGSFGVAQLDAVLAVTDRLLDLAGVEIRHFQRVEHRELLAVPLDVLRSLDDRLVVALHVGQRGDQRLLQARDVRPPARQFLGQRQRGRPIAVLEKCVEQ